MFRGRNCCQGVVLPPGSRVSVSLSGHRICSCDFERWDVDISCTSRLPIEMHNTLFYMSSTKPLSASHIPMSMSLQLLEYWALHIGSLNACTRTTINIPKFQTLISQHTSQEGRGSGNDYSGEVRRLATRACMRGSSHNTAGGAIKGNLATQVNSNFAQARTV